MENQSCLPRILDELNTAWLAGIEPSCLEIAAWADCDIHTAYKHLSRLAEDGVIRIITRGPRRRGERWRIQKANPAGTQAEDLHN
jgi:hypothetical protein